MFFDRSHFINRISKGPTVIERHNLTIFLFHFRFITPLVSISVDFYIRVFVKVEASAQKVKLSTSKLAIVYCCNGCENFHFQPMGTQVTVEQKTHFKNSRGPPVGPICDNCGGTFTMGKRLPLSEYTHFFIEFLLAIRFAHLKSLRY